MAPRILLCGDPCGRLNQLFNRIESISKSVGPFDALLCVGQFFPDSQEMVEEFMEYIEGRTPAPIPTYFIGDYGVNATKILSEISKKPENQGLTMDGLKVSHNLFWLRGSGVFKLFSGDESEKIGLSIAYLSGRKSFDQNDVDLVRALVKRSGAIDIFLTNEWPVGVTNEVAASADFSDSSCTNSTVSHLVMEIKPRYHIAGSMGVFYEREPYLNADATHITRFIGLAEVGNKNNWQYLHGLSPTPASIMSEEALSLNPPNTTPCPYPSTKRSC